MSENAPPSVQWYDELTPAEALDVALDNYEDYLEAARRHAALGAPEGVENAVDIAHAIANVLFDSHNSLNSASIPEVLQGIDWSLGERIETEERPGEPTVVKCISRTVEAMFAKELLQKVLEGSFGRFAKLLTLVRPAEAANWTADFFRHVGRCYVYGLNAECLIMCRGVLTASSKERSQTNALSCWAREALVVSLFPIVYESRRRAV